MDLNSGYYDIKVIFNLNILFSSNQLKILGTLRFLPIVSPWTFSTWRSIW